MELLLLYLLTLAGIIYCYGGRPVIKMIQKKDEDVILPCSFGATDIRSEIFDWKKDEKKEVFLYEKTDAYNNGRIGQDPQFKGRVFHFEDKLQSGDASIVIRKAKVTDSGSYKCIFPFHQPNIRSIVKLVVGSSPKPYVTILEQTKEWALLQCEVQGASPKPEVKWLDSANNTVHDKGPHFTERDGEYDVILQANVTKTDYYRCESSQKEINAKIYGKTYVYLNVSGSSDALVAAVVILSVLLAVVLLLNSKQIYKKVQTWLKSL